MKQIFIFSLLFLSVVIASAQSDFVPVGGTATGASGSVTYTVGQIAVQGAMKTFKIVKMR